jgi:hypothetical protein
MASILRSQGSYGRELLWQIRTLLASYRFFGHSHQETVNTRRQLNTAVRCFAVQLLSTPWYETAKHATFWLHSSPPTGTPMVVIDQESKQLTLRFIDDKPDDSALALK